METIQPDHETLEREEKSLEETIAEFIQLLEPQKRGFYDLTFPELNESETEIPEDRRSLLQEQAKLAKENEFRLIQIREPELSEQTQKTTVRARLNPQGHPSEADLVCDTIEGNSPQEKIVTRLHLAWAEEGRNISRWHIQSPDDLENNPDAMRRLRRLIKALKILEQSQSPTPEPLSFADNSPEASMKRLRMRQEEPTKLLIKFQSELDLQNDSDVPQEGDVSPVTEEESPEEQVGSRFKEFLKKIGEFLTQPR